MGKFKFRSRTRIQHAEETQILQLGSKSAYGRKPWALDIIIFHINRSVNLQCNTKKTKL